MTASLRPTWQDAPSIRTDATISPCGTYRYDLTREFDPKGEWILWIGLNPSTADHRNDDPTITREIDFSHGFGFPNLAKCNLYALRSKDPKDVKKAMLKGLDPVGPDNDAATARGSPRSASFSCPGATPRRSARRCSEGPGSCACSSARPSGR